MNFVRSIICSLPLVMAASLTGFAATTYVSGGGRDANTCTFAKPCRNIAKAISLASPGDTVVVLKMGRDATILCNRRHTAGPGPGG
jgi:hypothetical protein